MCWTREKHLCMDLIVHVSFLGEQRQVYKYTNTVIDDDDDFFFNL